MTDIWPAPVLDLIAARGARPVLEHGDRVVSGDELTTLIGRAAAGLRAAGAGPGDGVLLRLGVHPEAFATVLAAYAVGARVSGVRDDQVAAVRAADTFAVEVDDAALPALLGHDPVRVVPAGRSADVARILWTSGSTGAPKGCAQTYASMSAAWAPYPDRWPPAVRALATRLDRHLVFGTLASQVVLEYGVLALAAGGVLVLAEPPIYPEAVARHRATSGVITVGGLHRLVRDQRARPAALGSLRALLVSGSPLEPARLREAADVLGPVVFNGYGQTEAGMIAMLTPSETTAGILDTVGRPAIDVEVRDGELYVRSPAQADHYWRAPDETAEVFTGGWIRTRDLAELRPDGRLRLLGRARDVIIVQAELVHAGPVERVLASDPTVAEAYVVGAPHDDLGEAVHAFVVAAPGAVPDPEALRARVRDRFGPKAEPATVTLIDTVPLAASGKPDKRALLTAGGTGRSVLSGGAAG